MSSLFLLLPLMTLILSLLCSGCWPHLLGSHLSLSATLFADPHIDAYVGVAHYEFRPLVDAASVYLWL